MLSLPSEAWDALREDFAANQTTFIRRLRNRFPLEYARMVAMLPPKRVEVSGDAVPNCEPFAFSGWPPAQWERARRAIRMVLDYEHDPIQLLNEVAGIVEGCIPDPDKPYRGWMYETPCPGTAVPPINTVISDTENGAVPPINTVISNTVNGAVLPIDTVFSDAEA